MADPITIVLVDDAVDVRALVRMRLRLAGGFTVLGEGATGAEAIALAIELHPDVLLLDVSMPDVDGLDALVAVREAVPDTLVVMFSGFEEHGLAERARALGAAEFIEKSLPIDQLADRLAVVAGGAAPPAPPAPPTDAADVGGAGGVLDEHLERFRAAFDQAAIGMATLTLTGRVVRANRSLEALAGAGPAGLVGTMYEVLAEEPEEPEEPAGLAELTGAIAAVAAGARDSAVAEHAMAGRYVVSTVTVVRDSAHTPLYLFLQAQDITARRAAEEALRRSEERFRLLIEGVQDYAIFMLDPDGCISSWNRGAQRAKGYRADEAMGRHFSIFYLPDDVAAGHPQRELEIATRDGRYEEEGWRVRKDGSTFWASVVITAMRDQSGELIGFAKVTRDVTERKELLEELEAAAAAAAPNCWPSPPTSCAPRSPWSRASSPP